LIDNNKIRNIVSLILIYEWICSVKCKFPKKHLGIIIHAGSWHSDDPERRFLTPLSVIEWDLPPRRSGEDSGRIRIRQIVVDDENAFWCGSTLGQGPDVGSKMGYGRDLKR